MKTAEERYTDWFGSTNHTTRRSPSKANIIAVMEEHASQAFDLHEHNLNILEQFFTEIYNNKERPSRSDGLSAINFVRQCNEKGLYIIGMGYQSYLKGKKFSELYENAFEGGFAAMKELPSAPRKEE